MFNSLRNIYNRYETGRFAMKSVVASLFFHNCWLLFFLIAAIFTEWYGHFELFIPVLSARSETEKRSRLGRLGNSSESRIINRISLEFPNGFRRCLGSSSHICRSCRIKMIRHLSKDNYMLISSFIHVYQNVNVPCHPLSTLNLISD